MSHFLFIDESGQDHRESPYEVLAGVSVRDRDLWHLVQRLQQAEIDFFGRRYSRGERELKAKKLLSPKVFRKAGQLSPIACDERVRLAKSCLDDGEAAGFREITALAQAKLAYCSEVLKICEETGCRIFASIVVNPDINHTHRKDYLRRDYVYLLERFYYYLQGIRRGETGIVVMDELERSQSHLLYEQMSAYFLKTRNGQERSLAIIPEPLFVHSELSTGIQVADLVAYTLSWAFRRPRQLTKPKREELTDLVDAMCRMRHQSRPVIEGRRRRVWSIAELVAEEK